MRSAYGAKGDEIGQHAATIVVDVANVMGSRPDGWWRDRAGAAARLYAELAALAASGRTILPGETGEKSGEEFVMVLEGAARPAADRIAADRVAADRVAADRVAADRIAADRVAADRVAAESGPAGVQLVLAGGSGDDTIVALVRELPGRRFVVTADRELQRRCVAAGAEILRPSWLINELGKQ
jgi:8-oxo-dGTP diphosphatase